MTRLGLIDYGAGNFGSVRNALAYLGLDFVEVRDAAGLAGMSHLILPGVGAFAAAMRRLERLHLADAIREHALVAQKPILGICVGMQLFAEVGHEFESYPGLGLIPGSVDRIDVQEFGLPVPHMGWNDLSIRRTCSLLDGGDVPNFYFVHSYQYHPLDPEAVVATCDYGVSIPAVIQHENVFGVQFHPEKSQRDGLRLLRQFSAL